MTNRDLFKFVLKIATICSALIGALGTITNSVSLSYFIRQCQKGASRRIFILLNAFDLLVCVSNVLSIVFCFCEGPDYCGYSKLPFRLSFVVLDVSMEITGFATCLLGATRVISVCCPFYHLNRKALKAATAAFVGQDILRAVFRFYIFYVDPSKLNFFIEFDNVALMVLISVFILVNTTSSILLSWKLLTDVRNKRDSPINQDTTNRNKIRATVTVLIVSGFFLSFNIIFGIGEYFRTFVGSERMDAKVLVFVICAVWLALPLNSAVNPIIFFLRKREMREYVQQLPRALLKRLILKSSVKSETQAR